MPTRLIFSTLLAAMFVVAGSCASEPTDSDTAGDTATGDGGIADASKHPGDEGMATDGAGGDMRSDGGPNDAGGDTASIDAAGDISSSDTADVDMGPTPPLELGGCVLASGGDCEGVFGEEARFDPIATGGEIPLVTGPQGLEMLVFMARTTGIDPGTPDDLSNPDNPAVVLTLSDAAGDEVTESRRRMPFTERDDYQVTDSGLYVIVEGLDDLDGQTLTVDGEVTDAAGRVRTGTLTFVARR